MQNETIESGSAELNIEEYFGEAPLRWYQIAARNAVIKALSEGEKRILVELPTGSGKTITVACTMGAPEILKALDIKDRKIRVLFVAHKHRLLTQAESTFAADSNVELITHSMFADLTPEIIEAGWDVCILDECHHEGCSTFQYHLEKLGTRPIIGLTATKDRADGLLIKFDVIINPISREQAVEEGYLAETSIHTFVDVPSKDKINVLTDILTNFAHQMGQTMVFVKTKKEVTAVHNILVGMGFVSEAVLAQSERELNRILEDFSAGKVQFIINCNRISEGVDVKGCTDVVLGRQFGSYPQLNQVIGRAARPDSDCNVWELINPLSGKNLNTTVVVGTPNFHRLVSKEGGKWVERQFDYIAQRTNEQIGISSGIRIRHG